MVRAICHRQTISEKLVHNGELIFTIWFATIFFLFHFYILFILWTYFVLLIEAFIL